MIRDALDKNNGKQVHSPEEYRKNLSSMVSYLESTFPDAKLIFATTTPVPEGGPGRVAGDVRRYNTVAQDVVENHPAVVINDVYTFTKDCPPTWWIRPANVHFSPEGRDAQGAEVARVILSELQKMGSENGVTRFPCDTCEVFSMDLLFLSKS